MNIKTIDGYISDNKIDELENYFRALSDSEQKALIDLLICKLADYKMPQDSNKRNAVAIFLSEMKCDEAVPKIIEIIRNEKGSKYIGTLVYALQDLECAEYLEQIFDLIYIGNYEVRRNMFTLLEQNKDKITSGSFDKMKVDLNNAIEIYKDILLGLYITREEIFSDR